MAKYLLAIESSTSICSVALALNGKVLSKRETDEGLNHASLLTVYIDELFREHEISASMLCSIAVSKGPGSYTGLRIGVSTAKGICYAAGIPLIGITAIEAMALSLKGNADIIIPTIDAGRMEVYCAVYDGAGNEIEPIEARTITEDSFSRYSNRSRIILAGTGAAKFSDMLSGDRRVEVRSDVLPSADKLIKPAYKAFEQKMFEDVAYFEPFYLKAFKAGKPKVKGLFKTGT